MKNSFIILACISCTITIFQIHVIAEEPFLATPRSTFEPTQARNTQETQALEARQRMQAQHADEIRAVNQNYDTAQNVHVNTNKESLATRIIDSTATPANIVAEINKNLGSNKLTFKEQTDLAKALTKLKSLNANTPKGTKIAFLQTLEGVLTKIANQHGIKDITHTTFFTSLENAENTGIATNIFNVIKLKFAKLIAPYQSDKIIDSKIAVDLTNPSVKTQYEPARQKDIAEMKARHEKELAQLPGFQSVSPESTITPSKTISKAPTTLENLSANFQGEMAKIGNPNAKVAAMAKKFNTTPQELLRKIGTINTALEKPFSQLNVSEKQLIQNFLNKSNITTTLLEKDYATIKNQLLEITTFIRENTSIATHTAIKGNLPSSKQKTPSYNPSGFNTF